MPHPKLVLTEGVFKMRISWRECIAAYVGLLSIGGILCFGDLSTRSSTKVDALVGEEGREKLIKSLQP